MKYCFYFTLFLLLPSAMNGQRDYIFTDTSTQYGITLKFGDDFTNSHFCRIERYGTFSQYSPSYIIGYGFAKGRTYFSKEVNTGDSVQKVFLELLVQGNTTLFYYKPNLNNSQIFLLQAQTARHL